MKRADSVIGFTLVELLMGITLTGVLVLGASVFFAAVYGSIQRTERIASAEMTLMQTGHWMLRALADGGLGAHQLYPEFETPGCFLVGESGVRLRAGALQWRPSGRDCQGSGWLTLHDPGVLYVETMDWRSPMLCFTGRASSRQEPLFEWCSPWPYPISGP
ncbi:hypothetical protein [Aliidiomarina sanyensis]|uniref:Prepilin-type cleavage/methylation domain-containing protein n=1 Tax=Aliidiomarina sanyensis TaxID=1249555 RepID=A0A432WGE1_9GAMM|nr:hypothetical protein [Aliidiomarina sanyensis]RUO32811.1 hypothetical protein CWE11_07185 [Aliidiomarina sanyensis]